MDNGRPSFYKNAVGIVAQQTKQLVQENQSTWAIYHVICSKKGSHAADLVYSWLRSLNCHGFIGYHWK